MKSKLAIAIFLFGWFLFASFVIYDFTLYGTRIIEHFIQPAHPFELLFRLAMLTLPLGATITAYLINERKKFLESIKESEERYRDLYENAPDGYHSLGPDGTILEANNTWLKMLGYERGEVIGRMKITEHLTDEGLKTFEETFPVFKEKGHIEDVELDYRRKDGSLLPVIVNAVAVYDKDGRFLRTRSIVRDNTAKKEYEKRLRHVAEEWKATFDAMPYGVMLTDDKFNVIRANKYIAELSGISLRDVLFKKKCYEVIHRDNKPIDGCPLERSIKSKGVETYEYYETHSGRYFMEGVTPVFDGESRPIAYVHSMVNITEIKEKENKLIQSKDAFLNMLKDITSTYKELKSLHHDLIISFANAIDAKSHWTKGHSERVTDYATSIAKEMGLSEKDIELLRTACLLHDVGKIGTYDVILDKAEKLTDKEYALIKMHPAKGEDILKPIGPLGHLLPVIRSHHERFNGMGYPDGLKGEEIPLLARIIAVADSFDAITSDRPYRPAPGREFAIKELRQCAGTQFDPKVVTAFLRVLERCKEFIKEESGERKITNNQAPNSK